jgi:hypothetical protein
MLATEMERGLEERLHALEQQVFESRRQSHYYPATRCTWAGPGGLRGGAEEVSGARAPRTRASMRRRGSAEETLASVSTTLARSWSPSGRAVPRSPRSPEGALVRVLSFLPKSLVEKIHETGRPMSRYIREVLEEKLGE